MDWGMALFWFPLGTFVGLLLFSWAEERPRRDLLAKVAELAAQNRWLWGVIQDWNEELDRREKEEKKVVAELHAPDIGGEG